MIKSEAWKWDQVSEERWTEPAEDVYYLAARWQRDHRNKLLDLGCGIGRHSVFFAERGFAVDAFDLSESGVATLDKLAQEKHLPITTKVGDMLALPYPAGCFDCVLAFHVIFHTDRAGTERAIAEMRRVLAEAGEVYVTFNSLSNPVFSDPNNTHIGKNTIIKTEGIEAGIPHYGVDEPEVRRLMADFQLLSLTHVEEIKPSHHSWHYFVLARKPQRAIGE